MRFHIKNATALFAILAALPAIRCGAVDNRFLIANQSDFLAKRGFYVNFENSSADGSPCKISTLRLILGVADGKGWRYAVATPAWELGHTYDVLAVIGPGHAELRLDGKPVQGSDGGFMPLDGVPVDASMTPDWASAPAAYRIMQERVTLSEGGGKSASRSFAAALSRPLGLALFEPQMAERIPWNAAPGRTLTVTARFRIAPLADLASLQPFVDRYGQARYDDRKSKVRRDEDLAEAMRDEKSRLRAWPPLPGRDLGLNRVHSQQPLSYGCAL